MKRRSISRRTFAKVLGSGLLAPATALARERPRRGGAMPATSNPTLTLVNDSRMSPTVAGVPTHEFAFVFAPGQLPHRSVPVFTDNATGIPQPFSANPPNATRYWPDGSVMYCVFRLRPTFSIAAGASRTLTVTTKPGSWPAATRTSGEVLVQNFAINCPPSGVGSYQPTAQYGAFLTSANASNLMQTRRWLSGDAGETWCFTYKMSQTPGGRPHGQLVANIYVAALTYAPGGAGSPRLGGFRFFADLRQPFYTIDSPAKEICVFARPNPTTPALGLNYSVNGTAHVPGNWVWPATGVAMTTVAAPIDNSSPNSVYNSVMTGRITSFQASISDGTGAAPGNVLTVTSVLGPPNGNGHIFLGSLIHPNSAIYRPPYWGTILRQTSGTPGNTGTYIISGSAVLVTSTLMDAVASAVFVTDASPNPFLDGATGDYKVACAATFSGAALPGNMDRSHLYWLWYKPNNYGTSYDPGSTTMLIQSSLSSDTVGACGSGLRLTATPIPVVLWGNRFPICGADANYQFFRGTGAITTDTPLRSGVIDMAHWVASGAIPPLTTAQTGTTRGGIIGPFNFHAPSATASYSFTPYSYGPCLPEGSVRTGGNSDWINPIPNWPMHEFWNGDLVSYQNALKVALGAGLQAYDVADPAAPNVPLNFLDKTHRGIGASVKTLSIPWDFSSVGHTSPAGHAGTVNPIAVNDLSHQPGYASWGVIRTGRLEILDRALNAVNSIGSASAAIRNNPQPWTTNGDGVTHPTYTGATFNFPGPGDNVRSNAWLHRNVGLVAAYYPNDPSGLNNPGNISFDGSQTAQYLQDFFTVNYTLYKDMLNPGNRVYGASTAYICDLKEWIGIGSWGSFPDAVNAQTNPWMYALWAYQAGFSLISGNAAVRDFLVLMGQHWTNKINRFGGYNLYSSYDLTGICTDTAGVVSLASGQLMKSDDEWFNSTIWQISWKRGAPGPANRLFTVSGADPRYFCVGTDHGEYIVWSNGRYNYGAPPSGMKYNQIYVVCDAVNIGGSNWACNLKDKTGAYQSPANSGGPVQVAMTRVNSNPRVGAWPYDESYWMIFWAAAAWATAIGVQRGDSALVSAFATVLNDINYRNNHTGDGCLPNFVCGQNVRWALQSSFNRPS